MTEIILAFQKYYDIRDAIGFTRMLSKRCIGITKNHFVCFENFEKAFISTNFETLMDILKRRGVDNRD